jgi:hypothetical protein
MINIALPNGSNEEGLRMENAVSFTRNVFNNQHIYYVNKLFQSNHSKDMLSQVPSGRLVSELLLVTSLVSEFDYHTTKLLLIAGLRLSLDAIP